MHGRMTAAGCSPAVLIAVSSARTGESAGYRDDRKANDTGGPARLPSPYGMSARYMTGTWKAGRRYTSGGHTRAGRREWRGYAGPSRIARDAAPWRAGRPPVRPRVPPGVASPRGRTHPVLAGFHHREPVGAENLCQLAGCTLTAGCWICGPSTSPASAATRASSLSAAVGRSRK